MNAMQRRDFLKTTLVGAAGVGALAVPAAALHAARAKPAARPLQALLARAAGVDEAAYWRPLAQCGSDVCAAPARVRISVDHLQFPEGFGGLVIDAMFATTGGILPFRMASFQPDSLSPLSKPFVFEAAAAGLVGFRAEHAAAGDGSLSVAGSPLLGAMRPTLAAGRYLLALGHDPIDLAAIAVSADRSRPVIGRDGVEPAFGCIAFSVHALA